jgi:hypothetical protein
MTTYKTFTRENLFLLTYGIKAQIPAEVGYASHWVDYYASEGNEQSFKANLDFLEESQLTMEIRNEVYWHTIMLESRIEDSSLGIWCWES